MMIINKLILMMRRICDHCKSLKPNIITSTVGLDSKALLHADLCTACFIKRMAEVRRVALEFGYKEFVIKTAQERDAKGRFAKAKD